MAWDQAQVEAAQNAIPTDWSRFDKEMIDRSDEITNRYAKDNLLHVRFYMRPVIDQQASDTANRPIFRDVEYVEIMMPGEKHNIIARPAASMRDDLRFPKQYAQFKDGVKEQMNGTPLRVLPFATDALVEELAVLKIRTVEQLADLADTAQFMGMQALKRKAKEYLDMTTGGAALRAEMADLRKQNDDMRALLEARTAPKKSDEDILG